jgi:hypothetical protein
MRDDADETECLPQIGLGATVGSASPNGTRQSSATEWCDGKHGWRIAIQTLDKGSRSGVVPRARLYRRVGESGG